METQFTQVQILVQIGHQEIQQEIGVVLQVIVMVQNYLHANITVKFIKVLILEQIGLLSVIQKIGGIFHVIVMVQK